jgi:hypothetical protein
MSSASRVSQFLRPADDLKMANSAWILSEYFSRSYCKFGENNVAENDEAIFSICHIWSRDVIGVINAVPR